MQGRRNPGARGVIVPLQVLADILTLFQSRGADCAHQITKGQLISKCSFGVIVWTKIPMKNLTNFCPRI